MSRRMHIAGVVLFALAVAALVWTQSHAQISTGPAGPRDLPPSVLKKANVARERMERIVNAVGVCMNAHYVPPPQLSMLYPQYIDNPLVF